MYFNPETNIGKMVFQNINYEENSTLVEKYKEIYRTLDSFENKRQLLDRLREVSLLLD